MLREEIHTHTHTKKKSACFCNCTVYSNLFPGSKTRIPLSLQSSDSGICKSQISPLQIPGRQPRFCTQYYKISLKAVAVRSPTFSFLPRPAQPCCPPSNHPRRMAAAALHGCTSNPTQPSQCQYQCLGHRIHPPIPQIVSGVNLQAGILCRAVLQKATAS